MLRPSPSLHALAGLCLISTLAACSSGSGGARPSASVAGAASQKPASPTQRAGYKIGTPYRIGTTWYVPREDKSYDATGTASWYGADFHGKRTANGEIYDMGALTAAHPTLPLPTYVTVTNLANGRTLLVRVNDRGPYAKGRIIDLSYQSARALRFAEAGTAQVRVKYVGLAPLNGDTSRERRFLSEQSWTVPQPKRWAFGLW